MSDNNHTQKTKTEESKNLLSRTDKIKDTQIEILPQKLW